MCVCGFVFYVCACMHVHLCVRHFFFTENRATGTDLNLVFKHMLERIIIIEETTKAKFEDLRHIILIFTDGNSTSIQKYYSQG